MNIYFRGAEIISPQPTFAATQFTSPVEYFGNRLNCIEPDYREIIDTKLIRRMSRIIKMGIASAMECLKISKLDQPDAIITGTAFGCLEDTIIFLRKMTENSEEMLSPAAFIQSTHNSVGAQIALMLKCHNYNNTFTNRGHSFESAIMDSIMMLNDNEANNILVGGVDEITDVSHEVLNRFSLYKKENISNNQLFEKNSKGTIAGEGAAYFVLTNRETENNIARLKGMFTFYKPNGIPDIELNILTFLDKHEMNINDIDLMISGNSGDAGGEGIYKSVNENIFKKNTIINYKHLCGEYPTAVTFALWLAVHSIKSGKIPFHDKIIMNKKLNNILIYNNHMGIYHSLFLISAC